MNYHEQADCQIKTFKKKTYIEVVDLKIDFLLWVEVKQFQKPMT